MLEIERLSCMRLRNTWFICMKKKTIHKHMHIVDTRAQSNCLFGRHKINSLDDTMWMRPIRWVFREEIMSVTKVEEKGKKMGATSEKCLIWKIAFGLRFTLVCLSRRFILTKITEIYVKRVKIWQHHHLHFHRNCFHSLSDCDAMWPKTMKKKAGK